MAISRETFTTIQELLQWLTANLVPDYFSNISYDSGDPNIINFTSLDGNIIMTLTQHGSQQKFIAANLYSNNNSSVIFNSSSGMQIIYAAICNNGAIIRLSSSGINTDVNNTGTGAHCSLLITKNSNNKTMIIGGAVTATSTARSEALKTDVHCVSDGDNLDAESKLTFNVRNMDQTQLVPFVSSKLTNAVVYSPNAFYIQTGSLYAANYFAFEMNGVTYMSNGYWAIKDE